MDRAESPAGSSRKRQPSRRSQKLSEERLARKRELDRQAQRSARIKTKTHIAHLESRIETLTKVQGTGDVKSLVDQIEDQRKENEALRSTLKTIGKLIGSSGENVIMLETKIEVDDEKPTLLTSQHSPNSEEDNSEENDMHITGPSTSTNMVISNNGVGMGLGQPDPLSNTYLPALVPDCRRNDGKFFESHAGHTEEPEVTLTIPTAEALLHTASLFSESAWQSSMAQCCYKTVLLSNELLAQCSKLQLQNTSNQRIRDADIPIRAVLHGWNAVTERYALDPVWQTLRHADNAMFSQCVTPMERLVCLRVVSLKLRHQVNPTEQNLDALPFYLHERPSQQSIQHIPLIDYLVWPGLRERLVFNPHCYCCEKFATTFWPCFRFTWEYEFRDAYVCNLQTGVYQYSAQFLERSRELRSFRMIPKFFELFPELKADIPEAPPQSDFNATSFQGGGNSFDMGSSHGLESFPNLFVEGEGISQMDWPLIQQDMKVAEV